MSGSAAGAPLRAMASVAAIWILVRLVSWYSPVSVLYPGAAVDGYPGLRTVKPGAMARARPRLPVERNAMVPRKATEKYRSTAAGVRVPVLSPLPLRTTARMSASSRGLGPSSDEVRGFFLKASFRRPGDISGDSATIIPRFPEPPRGAQPKNLTAYFWIHARQNSAANPNVQGKPGRSTANGQYGGSQAGAILAYRVVDRAGPEISLYGRLSAALAPVSQEGIALGARVRPAANVPLAVHAEQRFDAGSGRPAGTAFYATGGTGPHLVAEKFMLETYAQAGYVLGRNETYFFDGSATVQRPIADSDGRRLLAGAGLWAGGQRDIHRLDVGPRVSLDLPSGTSSTRISIDARVRVAGNARPGSGAALTVATSF